MMSADSSLTKFIREQRSMLWRRLPLAALSTLMYFLYYIFGTVVLVQHERAIADPDTISLFTPLYQRLAETISAYAGLRGTVGFITFTGAVILGIQSFSFLFKSQTVDFYESRPEKRGVRFFNIFINSFIIYAVPSFLGAVLSFAITAASGASSSVLLSEILLSWVLNTVMFLATYGMSVFATLLTGTLVTAILMNMFIFGVEILIRFTVFAHMAGYYATFDSDNELNLIIGLKSLPPFNLAMSVIKAEIYKGFDERGVYLAKAMPELMKGCGINIIIIIISFALAYFAYKYRRSEDAGKAVTNPYVSIFIKYSAGVCFALNTGLFIFWIFDRQESMSFPAVILTMIVTVIVTALILEAIFALNVRSALKRAYDIPAILALSIVILFIFKMDVFGYDRWLPAAADVESAWLCNNSYDINLEPEYYDTTEYTGNREFTEKNMFLTDIEDMLIIAGEGQAAMVENASEYGRNYTFSAENYWNVTIGWRMKNGRMITRCIAIPESTDPAVMDRVIGSEEFARGVYLLDDPDEILRKVRGISPDGRLVLASSTEHGNLEGDGELLKGFLTEYMKDVNAYYDYTMASNNNPVGSVSFYTDNSLVSGYSGYIQTSWPVYDSYTDTIEFLEDNGLWNGGNLDASEIDKIEVSRINYVDDISNTEEPVVYTDKADIEKILDASLSSTYYSAWGKNSIYEDDPDTDYDIEVHPLPDVVEDADQGICYYRRLLKDRELP